MATAREERRPTEVVRGPGVAPIQLRVDGTLYSLEVEHRRTLLDASRVDLPLTGKQKVREKGQCGPCTALIDGVAVCSCLTLAVEREGREILTIEGLADGTRLDPVQEGFVEHDA